MPPPRAPRDEDAVRREAADAALNRRRRLASPSSYSSESKATAKVPEPKDPPRQGMALESAEETKEHEGNADREVSPKTPTERKEEESLWLDALVKCPLEQHQKSALFCLGKQKKCKKELEVTEEWYQCPWCKKTSPDEDTMQKHCMEEHPKKERENAQRWKQKAKEASKWHAPDKRGNNQWWFNDKFKPQRRAEPGPSERRRDSRDRKEDSRERPQQRRHEGRRSEPEDRRRRSPDMQDGGRRPRSPRMEDKRSSRGARPEHVQPHGGRWRSRSPSSTGPSASQVSLRESRMSRASNPAASSAQGDARVNSLADLLQAQATFLRNA